jgi:hypothetical protein
MTSLKMRWEKYGVDNLLPLRMLAGASYESEGLLVSAELKCDKLRTANNESIKTCPSELE